MKTTKALFGILAITMALAMNGRSDLSTPLLTGFDQQILDRNDDGSTGLVPIGFAINFYGNSHTELFVNNNGNVTFDNWYAAYTPQPLNILGIGIIAPFWADVDTRSPDSDVVRYGTRALDGHAAFGVDWVNVGYYSAHADKLLSCQLVMIDRSDIAPGDFDLEFNYSTVQWQWGDVSVDAPPRAGFSDGANDYELPGSGESGAFLDSSTGTGLIYNDLNSSVPGRYVFFFRDGTAVPEPTATTLVGLGLVVMVMTLRKRRGFIHAAPK